MMYIYKNTMEHWKLLLKTVKSRFFYHIYGKKGTNEGIASKLFKKVQWIEPSKFV